MDTIEGSSRSVSTQEGVQLNKMTGLQKHAWRIQTVDSAVIGHVVAAVGTDL